MLKQAFINSRFHKELKPVHKYWFFILGIACVIFIVIFASVACSWLNLSSEEQAYLTTLADRIIPFPILGSFVLLLIIGGLVTLLFRYYIIPILRMAESTQLISLANPDHRIPLQGAREVAQLAAVINASADAYQKLQLEVATAIRTSQAELKEEHNRFTALMSELPLGVLVCTTDGQIMLYNQQAQLLLQPSDQGKFTGEGQGGWIGLGRSVFGLLHRDPVIRGMELLLQAVNKGTSAPTTRFFAASLCGRSLNVTMAPFFDFHCEQGGQRRMSGMVLTLEEAASELINNQPEQPLQSRIEGLTAPQGPRPVYYAFDLFSQQDPLELGKQTLRKLTFVVFDTETTGLNPAQGDEIIQIGAVRIVNCRILQDEIIDQLIDPQRSIPATSVAIHGISPRMVAGQPTIYQVLPHFHRFAEGAVLVAHNAAFDMRCLQIKEAQTGLRFDHPVLDTLLLSSIIHPHQDTHSLDGIAKRFNINNIGRHTALGDALVTAELLVKLIPLLESRGILTLEDALKASIKSQYAKLHY